MKTIWGISGIVILAFALSGCGGGAEQATAVSPSPSANLNAAFLTAWHVDFPNSDDAKAISVGHDVCDAYKAGTTFEGELAYIMALAPQLTARQAGGIIGASTAAYCPEYSNRH